MASLLVRIYHPGQPGYTVLAPLFLPAPYTYVAAILRTSARSFQLHSQFSALHRPIDRHGQNSFKDRSKTWRLFLSPLYLRYGLTSRLRNCETETILKSCTLFLAINQLNILLVILFFANFAWRERECFKDNNLKHSSLFWQVGGGKELLNARYNAKKTMAPDPSFGGKMH